MSIRGGKSEGWRAAMTALLLLVSTAAARSEDVPKLQAVPEQIKLEPGAFAQDIVVIAHATTDATWLAADLVLPGGGAITLTSGSKPALPASGDIAWTVHVAASERAAKDSAIPLRVDYRIRIKPSAAGAEPVERQGTIAATLQVGYAPLQLSQSVKATIQHGFGSLKPKDPEDSVLTVENTGIDDVVLNDAKSLWPDFIELKVAGGLPATIPGRSSRTLRIVLTAGDRVPQGSVPLLVQLQLARGAQSASVIIADTVSVGIPGLSDIKTFFQLPSLFILPGLLIVLTWGLLWRLFHPAPAHDAPPPKFPPSYKSEEFYLYTVTLSVIICWLYSWYRNYPFDFLDRISMSDLVFIWFGSIAFAVVTYLIGRLIYRKLSSIAEANRAEEFRRNNPIAEEAASATLEKLARRQQNFHLTAYNLGGRQFFRLPFGEAPDGQTWLIPAMQISVLPGAGAPALGAAADDIIETGNSEALRAHIAANPDRFRLQWQAVPGPSGPRLVASTDLGAEQGTQSAVRRI